MAGLRSVRLQAPSLGVDQLTAPDAHHRLKAPLHKNLVLGRNGLVVPRGPLTTKTATLNAAVASTPAIWAHKDGSGEYALLAPGFGALTLKAVDLPAMTTTDVTVANTDLIPGGRFASHGTSVFGYSQAGTSLLEWFRPAGTHTVTQMTACPQNGKDVCSHLARFWVLDGGTGIFTSNGPHVHYTDPGFGVGFNASAAWQDDITGAVRLINLGTQAGFATALARVGRSLAFLCENGIHLLIGDTETSWVLRTVVHGIGTTHKHSVIEYNDGVFFMSKEGYMYYDGAQVRNVSDPVVDLLTLSRTCSIRAVKLDTEHLLLTAVTPQGVGGTSTSTFGTWILHIPTETWTQFTTAASVLHSQNSLPTFVGRSSNYPFFWDDRRLWLADKVATPELVAQTSRGFDVGAVQTEYIPAQFTSRLLRLAGPTLRAQLSRLMVDYAYTVPGGPANAALAGWRITAGDETSATRFFNATATGTVSGTQLQTWQSDVKQETSMFQLTARMPTRAEVGLVEPADAALFGASVEYQETRQKA